MADIPDETEETLRRWSETVGTPSDIVKDVAQAGSERAAPIPGAAADEKSAAGKAASPTGRAAEPVADEAKHASIRER